MTDQELNEWIAIHVMEWKDWSCELHNFKNGAKDPDCALWLSKDETGKFVLNGLTVTKPYYCEDPEHLPPDVNGDSTHIHPHNGWAGPLGNGQEYWDPCNNLNHAYLMEKKKILNTPTITTYLHQLAITVGFVVGDFFGVFPLCDMVNASARQRCEAAFLALHTERADKS